MVFSLGPRAAAAAYQLTAFDSVDSTNAEALNAARSGVRGPAWYATTHQTAGRGRRNRPWIAPRGNLACSVLEVTDASSAVAATLGFAAGLALKDALDGVSMEARFRAAEADAAESGSLRFTLKWPNDVLADGRKLAGILLEAEAVADGRLAVVIGIGTNVVAYPQGTPYPATSLASLGVYVAAEELFGALSDAWAEYRAIWDGGRGFGEIRRRWLKHAAGLGEAVSIRSAGAAVAGTFETIDETGSLIVRTAERRLVPITAGDVFFGPTASAGAA